MKTPTARKLPSGSWYVRVRIDGEDVSITRPTEEEAVAEAMSLKAGLIKLRKSPELKTLKDAYSAYIKSCTSHSPSTIAGYTRLSRNTFQNLMDRPMASLSNELISKEVLAMHNAGKSKKYIANAIGLLRPVLKTYYPDFELDIKMPKTRTKSQKRKKSFSPLPSDAAITLIMRECKGTEIELPVLMALWLGMRMSEIRAVKKSDFTGNLLHIQRAIVDDVDGKPVEKDTKTENSERWVEVPEYILNLIPKELPQDAYIMTMSGQALYKRFSRMLEKAGLPHYRFHDLRHANAAAMIRQGMDSRYAMERNGWSTDYMYKKVYGYTMDDKMSEESKKLDAYFLHKLSSDVKNGDET